MPVKEGRTRSGLIVYRAFSLAVSIMAGTIVGIEKWKEEKWTVLADWTIVRQAPRVEVSDEKTVESPSGNV